MEAVGVICEWNPFHLGHEKLLRLLRESLDAPIVCVMSGNYVQRGAPAVFDKSVRAHAGLLCGADLVLELPVTGALSSAEGFAACGVRTLAPLCTALAFGCETADEARLRATAQALLSPEFSQALRAPLDAGLSFPAARAAALESMGADAALLRKPNDLLAVEYTKAVLSQGAALRLLPVHREGDYHAAVPDKDNPSAGALRARIEAGQDWLSYVPPACVPLFAAASVHTLKAGERAVLARLRTMTDEEFAALPYGSEGLWRRLMHACRREADLEGIVSSVKTKRYTRTRLDRMVLCAFLSVTERTLSAPPPYVRVLGFTERGRALLHEKRGALPLRGAEEPGEGDYGALEARCDSLYGLFCTDAPEAPERVRKTLYMRQ